MAQQKTERLPVALTADEVRAFQAEILRALGERKKAVGEAEAIKESAKIQIKAKEATVKTLEDRLEHLRDCLEKMTETREVACVERIDWAEGVVRIYRTDTGAQIDLRAIQAGERQMHLRDVEKKAAEEKKAKEEAAKRERAAKASGAEDPDEVDAVTMDPAEVRDRLATLPVEDARKRIELACAAAELPSQKSQVLDLFEAAEVAGKDRKSVHATIGLLRAGLRAADEELTILEPGE